MADKPTSKTKRRVKNPETFRERAVKAAEAGDKPRRATRAKQKAGKTAGKVLGPVGRTLRKIGSLKAFRWLRKPLRIIGRIIVPVYFRSSWQELKLVTWPTWKKSLHLTYAVLVFAVIFGAAIAGVDWCLDRLFRDILLK